jgi:two-component system cell cycle response regulator
MAHRPVLVAEDNAVMQSVLRTMLTWWDFEPLVAADGAEAWRILQSPDAPRLAIVDWQMPGMDGVEVCRRVRASAGGDYTYLVLLTARDNSADVVAGLDAGADDYLTKPFNAHELRARLRAGTRIVQLQEDLETARKTLSDANATDRLTGMMHRATIVQALERELAAGRSPAILLADIDRLRHINSSFGQPAGDSVLLECARRLRAAAPDFAKIGRYAGDEFLILLRDCGVDLAGRYADAMRSAAATRPFTFGAASFPVTCTVAVACPELSDTATVLRIAEEALNAAKRESRERLTETLLNRGVAMSLHHSRPAP